MSFRSRDERNVILLHIHRPGRYAVQAWTMTPDAEEAGTRFDSVARAEETRVWHALRRVAAWRKTPPEQGARR